MKDIEQMITEQVRSWSKREAEAKSRGEARGAWPIITLSRQVGANGTAFAKMLGQRMDFEVWDKTLLNAVAEEGGGDVTLLKSLDEHHRKAIDDAVSGILRGNQHTNTHYFRALLRVVHTIAAHGRSIIVGRGANYICKSPSILRLRVVRPMDARVPAYVEKAGVSEKEARRQIEEMDNHRDEFVRYHFRRDVRDPADYDLVLNAGTLSMEQMVDLAVTAYEYKVKKPVTVRA